MSELAASQLGKQTTYTDQYDPKLLFAICRDGNRQNIGIDIKNLPFQGVDIWNGFDFTWLDELGVPQYGMLTLYVPCDSPNLIESKSLKLYLFSFANTRFKNTDTIMQLISDDLSTVAGKTVAVVLADQLDDFLRIQTNFSGINLDNLDVICNDLDVNPELLICNSNKIVSEQLCSDLLKSNCLVTGKPDWGSVRITYTGAEIGHASLLKYIISYRNHQGFHEQCIEHIFYDILQICQPTQLTVAGRYTRRGGLDINPLRYNGDQPAVNNCRLFRQ